MPVLKEGTKVEYKPTAAERTSTGIIKQIYTTPDKSGDNPKLAQASEDKPFYGIENERTGKITVYPNDYVVQVLDEP